MMSSHSGGFHVEYKSSVESGWVAMRSNELLVLLRCRVSLHVDRLFSIVAQSEVSLGRYDRTEVIELRLSNVAR
jgi:hypothetical protein